jgi:hypothetical protein
VAEDKDWRVECFARTWMVMEETHVVCWFAEPNAERNARLVCALANDLDMTAYDLGVEAGRCA